MERFRLEVSVSIQIVLIFRYYRFSFVFFKQNTAYEMRISDWSSYVCSSDLASVVAVSAGRHANDDEGSRDGAVAEHQELIFRPVAADPAVDDDQTAGRGRPQLLQRNRLVCLPPRRRTSA